MEDDRSRNESRVKISRKKTRLLYKYSAKNEEINIHTRNLRSLQDSFMHFGTNAISAGAIGSNINKWLKTWLTATEQQQLKSNSLSNPEFQKILECIEDKIGEMIESNEEFYRKIYDE